MFSRRLKVRQIALVGLAALAFASVLYVYGAHGGGGGSADQRQQQPSQEAKWFLPRQRPGVAASSEYQRRREHELRTQQQQQQQGLLQSREERVVDVTNASEEGSGVDKDKDEEGPREVSIQQQQQQQQQGQGQEQGHGETRDPDADPDDADAPGDEETATVEQGQEGAKPTAETELRGVDSSIHGATGSAGTTEAARKADVDQGTEPDEEAAASSSGGSSSQPRSAGSIPSVFHDASDDEQVNAIRAKVKAMNGNLVIHNDNTLPPLTDDFHVIVIQIHNRLLYLRHTLQSLSVAEGIANTLLVLSHDFWDDDLMAYIRASVTFCRYVQIFMPHSMQLHPASYPGDSPNDCPRDASRTEAKMKNCLNADFPDMYGHYREAKFTMIKHHWWWKANIVMDHLSLTRNRAGPVVFLEEDHVVAPDILPMLALLTESKPRYCPDCLVIGMGNYAYPMEIAVTSRRATVTAWRSNLHNMGMALDRDAWSKLKQCKKQFCTYDDYNWDWSLQYVASACLGTLKTLTVQVSRVSHIGTCGAHASQHSPGKPCDPEGTAAVLRTLWKENDKHLIRFEQKSYRALWTLADVHETDMFTQQPTPNGGWGDSRDHALCLEHSLPIG